jgi:hypothetical protein
LTGGAGLSSSLFSAARQFRQQIVLFDELCPQPRHFLTSTSYSAK